eukprot:850726-Prymnesium_polylepis.1
MRWAGKSAPARMKSRYLVQHLYCAAWPADAVPNASSRTSSNQATCRYRHSEGIPHKGLQGQWAWARAS